jgi:hypothetical protein
MLYRLTDLLLNRIVIFDSGLRVRKRVISELSVPRNRMNDCIGGCMAGSQKRRGLADAHGQRCVGATALPRLRSLGWQALGASWYAAVLSLAS